MSNDGYVQVPADSVGKKVDASSLTVGADIVVRQRMVIADSSNPNALATVNSANALVVAGNVNIDAVSATVTVHGTVSLSGVVQVSVVDPVTLGPGTDNIGAISLGPGTSNIGFLDSISKTVQVQVASRISIDNISATVTTLVAGVKDTASGNQVAVGDSANTAVRVNIVAGAASGVSQVDDTSFSARAAAFVPVGGVWADSGNGASLSASHGGAVRMTGMRAFHTNLRTDGGQTMEDSANTALRVNIVAGSAAGVSQVDDTSFSARAAAFVPIGGVWADSGNGASISVSHAGAIRMTGFRAMHVNLRDSNGSEVTSSNPLSVKVENQSATHSVVLAAGAANIGTLNGISATIAATLASGTNNIGAVSLGAGGANIGYINNISATVSVILAAGTANFGTLNNISRTVSVVVAAGTANIGDVNAISRTVAAVISTNVPVDFISRSVDVIVHGTIDAISATVTVTTSNPWIVAELSGSHGPTTSVFSTSAFSSVIAAPGAGNYVYVTMAAATNAGTVNTNIRMGPSASTSAVQMYCVSSGGGFVLYFDPPLKCPVNDPFKASCKPNAVGDVRLVLNFFVRNS